MTRSASWNLTRVREKSRRLNARCIAIVDTLTPSHEAAPAVLLALNLAVVQCNLQETTK